MIEKIFNIRQIDGDKILLKVLGIERGVILNEINIANAITFFTKVAKLYFEEFAHDNLLKEAEIYCTYLEKENGKLRRESERTCGHYERLVNTITERNEEIKNLKEVGNSSHIIQVKKLKEEIKNLKVLVDINKIDQFKKLEKEIKDLQTANDNMKEKNKNIHEMFNSQLSKNKMLKDQLNKQDEQISSLLNKDTDSDFNIEFVRMVLGRALKQGVI